MLKEGQIRRFKIKGLPDIRLVHYSVSYDTWTCIFQEEFFPQCTTLTKEKLESRTEVVEEGDGDKMNKQRLTGMMYGLYKTLTLYGIDFEDMERIDNIISSFYMRLGRDRYDELKSLLDELEQYLGCEHSEFIRAKTHYELECIEEMEKKLNQKKEESKSVYELNQERRTNYTFDDFPVGTRVQVVTTCVDFHFFNNETGVVEANNNRYLGIKVLFDKPRKYESGYIQDTFGFNPHDLKPI